MSSLVEVLYPLPDMRRTPLTTIRWWESRRRIFNKAVGAAGLVTLAGVSLFAALPPYSSLVPLPMMLVAVAVYGTLANACYTLGWMTELLARRVWGRSAPDLGPLLFREGLIFSVGLTLFRCSCRCFSGSPEPWRGSRRNGASSPGAPRYAPGLRPELIAILIR